MPKAEIKQINQIKQVDCVTDLDKTLTMEGISMGNLEVYCNHCKAIFTVMAVNGTIEFIKSEIGSNRPIFGDVELIQDKDGGYTARISCDYAGGNNSEMQAELF